MQSNVFEMGKEKKIGSCITKQIIKAFTQVANVHNTANAVGVGIL